MKRRSALREDVLDDDEVTLPPHPAPLFASLRALCPFATSVGGKLAHASHGARRGSTRPNKRTAHIWHVNRPLGASHHPVRSLRVPDGRVHRRPYRRVRPSAHNTDTHSISSQPSSCAAPPHAPPPSQSILWWGSWTYAVCGEGGGAATTANHIRPTACAEAAAHGELGEGPPRSCSCL